ncbi:hypothetical protein BKA81DRAFT_371410 [Phyllosticta paracitricarpa]|uniref:Secreted protein n=2 Tax=Phyllosticta TaxID=121621 RepID=A0ABR1L7J8_9PEZI
MARPLSIYLYLHFLFVSSIFRVFIFIVYVFLIEERAQASKKHTCRSPCFACKYPCCNHSASACPRPKRRPCQRGRRHRGAAQMVPL